MSAELRKEIIDPAPRNANFSKVLACPACHQEMLSPDDDLPLHMFQGKTCIGGGTPGGPSKSGAVIREPLIIPDVSQLSVSEILEADTCLACGGPKTPGQTVCTTDYHALPFINQKMLPDRVCGYLFAEEKREIGGIKKNQFMEVFKAALTALAEMRSQS